MREEDEAQEGRAICSWPHSGSGGKPSLRANSHTHLALALLTAFAVLVTTADTSFTRTPNNPCRCCDSAAVCRASSVTVQRVHICSCSLFHLHPRTGPGRVEDREPEHEDAEVRANERISEDDSLSLPLWKPSDQSPYKTFRIPLPLNVQLQGKRQQRT